MRGEYTKAGDMSVCLDLSLWLQREVSGALWTSGFLPVSSLLKYILRASFQRPCPGTSRLRLALFQCSTHTFPATLGFWPEYQSVGFWPEYQSVWSMGAAHACVLQVAVVGVGGTCRWLGVCANACGGQELGFQCLPLLPDTWCLVEPRTHRLAGLAGMISETFLFLLPPTQDYMGADDFKFCSRVSKHFAHWLTFLLPFNTWVIFFFREKDSQETQEKNFRKIIAPTRLPHSFL